VYVYVFVYVEWLVVRKYLKGMNQFFWEWIEMSVKIWRDVVRGDPLIQGLGPHPEAAATSSRGGDLIQGRRPHPGVGTSSRGWDLIQGLGPHPGVGTPHPGAAPDCNWILSWWAIPQ
jgi:hypothetical protein